MAHDAGDPERSPERDDVRTIVDAVRRTVRRRAARRNHRALAWSTFTALGTIGWSFSLPVVLGVFVGRAVDARIPSPSHWTIVGLIVGLVVGSLTAWRAVREGWRDR